jgi:hypothetical protein
MSGHGYTLPATAICPGCGEMVVLPKEPLFPDSPPAICSTCESEVPDYRRESYTPSSPLPAQPVAPAPRPVEQTPLENRRYSRGGLLKSLGGILAERGAEAVENAKDRFPT